MKTGLIIGIIVVLVIGGGYFAMNLGKPAGNPTPTPNPAANSNPSSNIPMRYRVRTANFAFSPATLTIKEGDTVTWTNNDNAPHTITSDSDSEIDSSPFENGQTFSHTFSQAGTYKYHCAVHTGMRGEVVVQ